MIVPGSELKIYIATRPVDFRCGHDGLAAKVQEMLGLDPFLCVGRDYVAEAP
ncbi:IS66 family insertion sequence element accessory protein TnpB [Bradyrhizobium sp. SBR1B]|uniref:IS66 family insertion sequence element accessory protein TnpB n=1 Tax=Bradyrhizobium sp. SBR1B TaxID=2663836 RepID=UPI00160672CC|nr:transposase [Bradyrhizobium sp. SBR1B]